MIPRGKPFLARATGETYLQLHTDNLDLDDPAAILEFANEFGLLMGFHGYDRFFDWLQFPLADRAFVVSATALDELPRELLATPTLPARILRPAGRQGDRVGETLDEFRFAAHCIRDLIEAWRLISGVIEPANLSWQLPFAAPIPPEEAPRILTRGLNAGLANLHPRLEPLPAQPANPDTSRGPTVCLYEICCLELYTHIVSKAVYRRCANERCRKLFVRKNQGTAHRRSRTKGVKYCSDRCEYAQTQRVHRRRLASAT